MPKEIAHICIARKMAEKLPPKSLFHNPVKDHLLVYLYGSLATDSFYFYLAGPYKKEIKALSGRFHQPDQKGLKPILQFLTHYRNQNPQALAFAAGVGCHLITDSWFHPMVYYFSGIKGLHEGADARHRAFETAMDLYFRSLETTEKPISVDSVFSHITRSPQMISAFFNVLFQLTHQKTAKLIYAVIWHRVACWMFQNPTAYRLFRFLYHYRLGVPADYETLFYPTQKPVALPFFDHDIRYRHPVTGRLICQSIDFMVDRIVEQSITLLSILEGAILDHTDLSRCLDHENFPDIAPDISLSQFKYWLGQKDIHPLIYQGLNSSLYTRKQT